MLEFFENLIQSLASIVNSLGYLGVFLGMTIESSFFPFPSEAILVPAGMLVKKAQMNFFVVFFLGVAGSLIGALINYAIGYFIGRQGVEKLISKYGHFLFLKKSSLEKSDRYFKDYGEITTFVGRLFPVVRQLISLPAGFSRMHLGKFTLYTCLGAGVWTGFLILFGFFLEKGLVSDSIVAEILIFGVAALAIVFYIIARKRFK